MTSEMLLFGLRLLSGGLLLLFVGLLFGVTWREFRMMAGEVEARQRRRGQLILIDSDLTDPANVTPPNGLTYPLLPLTSIGRAPTNTIVLNDAFASAEHVLIVLRSGQWWLEDRGSANGTLLNGEKLEEPTVISSGDVVGIGRIGLKVELD